MLRPGLAMKVSFIARLGFRFSREDFKTIFPAWR